MIAAMRLLCVLGMAAFLLGSMLLGIFAGTGVVAFIWGPTILDTALGDPPDRSHPAFGVCLLVMMPAMLVNAVGAIAGVIVPVSYAARIRMSVVEGREYYRPLLRTYASWLLALARLEGPRKRTRRVP